MVGISKNGIGGLLAFCIIQPFFYACAQLFLISPRATSFRERWVNGEEKYSDCDDDDVIKFKVCTGDMTHSYLL